MFSPSSRSAFRLLVALVAVVLIQSWTASASSSNPEKLADSLRRLPEVLHHAVHVDMYDMLQPEHNLEATEATPEDANLSGSKTVHCAFDTAAADQLVLQSGDEAVDRLYVDPECAGVFKARKSSATTGGPVPFYTGTGTPIDAGRAWLMVGGAAIAAAALLI